MLLRELNRRRECSLASADSFVATAILLNISSGLRAGKFGVSTHRTEIAIWTSDIAL